MRTRAILPFAVVIITLTPLTFGAESCCDTVSDHEKCQATCRESTVAPTASIWDQLEKFASLVTECPESQVELWSCVRDRYPVLHDQYIWPGRFCCHLGLTQRCEDTCRNANSPSDVTSWCDPSQAPRFFQCLKKQQDTSCCTSVSVSDQCRLLCQSVILADAGFTDVHRQATMQHCGQATDHVLQCIGNHTQNSRSHLESIQCCRRAPSSSCKKACRSVLSSHINQRQLMVELVRGCGEVDPANEMWNCLFRDAGNQPETAVTGDHQDLHSMDGAKLHCCDRAVTTECRQACVKSFSKVWSNNWNEFDMHCQRNQAESALRVCLAEVDEPCRMGCSGLNYCTNFNYRPTEMFRGCHAHADNAAFSLYQPGQKDPLIRSLNMPSAIDISKCQPDIRKAVVCALSIKPCHTRSHTTWLCRSSCKLLLDRCLNIVQPSDVGTNTETLCNLISPPDDTSPCISLYPYLEPSSFEFITADVTHPCTPNPCNATSVCLVNRRACKHPERCPEYVCKVACTLGGQSQLKVPHGTHVLVPLGGVKHGCQRTCKCGHNGELQHCYPLPCPSEKRCTLSQHSSERVDPGRVLTFGCNTCVCHHGDMLCSMRECHGLKSYPGRSHQSTGLPCNCSTDFRPVCGRNSKTYPSTCIAKCLGLKGHQLTRGECRLLDPCEHSPCAGRASCYPRRRTCLSPDESECPQYECVSLTASCSHFHDPVCDDNGVEHTNLCHLLHKGQRLAYYGYCRPSCNKSNVVCAHNGETYLSECDALSGGSTVDYEGPCLTAGQFSADQGTYGCAGIRCPRPPPCVGVVPPGGCCPICGGILRVLYSNKLAVTTASTARLPPITVQNITHHIQRHLTVPCCDAHAYLSIESELVILITPNSKRPSQLQVEACSKEAEQIWALLEISSPALTLDLALASFVRVSLQTSSFAAATSGAYGASHLAWSATYPGVGLLTVVIACLLSLAER